MCDAADWCCAHSRYGNCYVEPQMGEQPPSRRAVRHLLVSPTGFSKGGTNPLTFQIDVRGLGSLAGFCEPP